MVAITILNSGLRKYPDIRRVAGPVTVSDRDVYIFSENKMEV